MLKRQKFENFSFQYKLESLVTYFLQNNPIFYHLKIQKY